MSQEPQSAGALTKVHGEVAGFLHPPSPPHGLATP
jgi:hypothetical protein